MKFWHRKSKWEKATDQVTHNPVVRRSVSAVLAVATLSAASSAVSALRRKQNS